VRPGIGYVAGKKGGEYERCYGERKKK